MSDKPVNKVMEAARQWCVAHTLQDQLAALREIERRRIIEESCERIIRDDAETQTHRLVLPLDGAD